MSLKNQIDLNKVPHHVAIIMDGNGRWAEHHGQARVYGHLNGVNAVRESLKAAREIGVKYLTLYAFSTENWNRPKSEVDALMDLLVKTIVDEIDELHQNEVRLTAIGDLNHLPGACKQVLIDAMERTKNNENINLILALSYSSRWEITETVKKIASEVKSGNLNIDDIDPGVIDAHLATAGIPDPELLIRTSGENRISNFLLWQLAYTELYFTEIFWPDFNKENFFEAIISYQSRERRFGKIGEPLLQK